MTNTFQTEKENTLLELNTLVYKEDGTHILSITTGEGGGEQEVRSYFLPSSTQFKTGPFDLFPFWLFLHPFTPIQFSFQSAYPVFISIKFHL